MKTFDKHGIQMISNAIYDKNSKMTKVTIGSNIKQFTPLELSVTKFNVMGRFIEYHMMNHDVNGMIVGYAIDTVRLDKIKNERTNALFIRQSFLKRKIQNSKERN